MLFFFLFKISTWSCRFVFISLWWSFAFGNIIITGSIMSSPAEKALQLVKYLPRASLNNLVRNPYHKKKVNIRRRRTLWAITFLILLFRISTNAVSFAKLKLSIRAIESEGDSGPSAMKADEHRFTWKSLLKTTTLTSSKQLILNV